MSNPRVRLVILLMLTWLSTWYVTSQLIIPNVDTRIAFVNLSLEGQNEPPYRYRLFEPVVNKAIQDSLLSSIADAKIQHVASYFLFSLIVFALLYYLLYRYFIHFFTPQIALIGLLLFQVAVPLAVTGFYMEGDFVTVVVYLAALNLMLDKKDRWMPLAVGFGAFVREQTIFILLIYLIYHYANHTLTRQRLIMIGISGLIFGTIFIVLRLALGVIPTTYTTAFHISENLSPGRLFIRTIPLWLAEIIGFLTLSIMAYRRSHSFFRLTLFSLSIYVVLFFFNGLLNELGKFLPAHLILIPMSLQVLTGEYISDAKLKS